MLSRGNLGNEPRHIGQWPLIKINLDKILAQPSMTHSVSHQFLFVQLFGCAGSLYHYTHKDPVPIYV